MRLPALRRLDLFEQLAGPADGPALDAHRRLEERLVVGLLGVARQRRGLVLPVLALVDALALLQRLARLLVGDGELGVGGNDGVHCTPRPFSAHPSPWFRCPTTPRSRAPARTPRARSLSPPLMRR